MLQKSTIVGRNVPQVSDIFCPDFVSVRRLLLSFVLCFLKERFQMIQSRTCLGIWLCATATMAMASASAQPVPPTITGANTDSAPALTAPAAAEIGAVHLSVQLEGGISLNPAGPKQDFGQLFTDRPNQPILNQVLITASKALDPKATDFDWGFKLQALYGADARYTHFLGEFDRLLPESDRNQIDLVEANVMVHVHGLTAGGIDIKAGQYSTPLGFETIDPSTNPFYSHSYIFNFGLPLKHTGVLTTSHITPWLDLYLGVDTGVNTTLGPHGDNNSAAAVLGGFGLTLLDGDLTVLALTHIGPENAARSFLRGYNVDGFQRYVNDVIVTWKATPKTTLTTEANLIRDDALGSGASGIPKPANAFGIAQYASYTLTDTVTLNARAELFRDDNGMFVSAYPGNDGFVNAELGLPALVLFAPHPTTYSALTLGFTYKPDVPAPLTGLMIRPEIRYDRALGGSRPFNGGRDQGSLTLAADVILTF